MINDEEIVQLYIDGKTFREIAPLAGICYQTVQNILRRNHVVRRRRGPRGRKYPDIKHRAWQRGIERLYGITEAEYVALLDKQCGVCAICKRLPKGRLCVDHVHDETKRVRGLLCKPCNHAVGLLKDSPEAASNLYVYLTQ